MASTSEESGHASHKKNLDMLLEKLKEVRVTSNIEQKRVYNRIEGTHKFLFIKFSLCN